jgi:hypothetical protein
MTRAFIVCVGLACAGCGQANETEVNELNQALGAGEAEVVFEGCTEFAGFGEVPAQNAAALVPGAYDVFLLASGNAQIVVRAVECDSISVGAGQPKPGTLSQIGITIAGGDASADINNYTLWYVTDHAKLHATLRSAGLASVKEPGLSYVLNGDDLAIASDNPTTPSYEASGSVSAPVGAPWVFVATWWEDGRHGTVAARTDFPAITFTFDGSIELNTPTGSDLAALIGGSTLTFPNLNSHNSFDEAVMTVTPQ